MSDFEDAIGDMTDTLLEEAGLECLYIRGTDTTTLTMRRSTGRPQFVDNGQGHVLEVRPVDFICRTSALPYTTPQAGDVVKCSGIRYELQPVGGEKAFRQMSPQMTRLHTRQIG